MFIINKESNKIEEIQKKSFSELGFREREHLQEWLEDNPAALGEDLLIIQKEFSGFSDTNERLDLLAIDKQGNLVIIENKLDDSGKHVTWQCLKYASYCSSLKKSQILKIYQEYLLRKGSDIKAEDAISEFLDGLEIEEISLNSGLTQRLILVAGNFRKEVTSTVIWLLNYGVRLQCFQVSPFAFGEQLFLNVEQIIPMKEAEEYSISMAEKTQEDIASQTEVKHKQILRRKYWTNLLSSINEKSTLFQNISPSKSHWISASSGVRGVSYNFCVAKSYCRVEVYIDRGYKEENEFLYDTIHSNKDQIEKTFNDRLIWERLDAKRGCRVKFQKNEFDINNEDLWEQSYAILTELMVRMEKAFVPVIKTLNQKLKSFSA